MLMAASAGQNVETDIQKDIGRDVVSWSQQNIERYVPPFHVGQV